MRQASVKPQVIAIIGPTASGKSGLAVRLAKKYGGEVISADSRQVYTGLTIGSGKITKREMKGVPHHLLDVASPLETFTVAKFKRLAEKKIKEIQKRGNIPILAGGTGFYIDAVLYDLSIPAVPPNKKLRARLRKKSIGELLDILETLDPERAVTIDYHNKQRLIRAIEIAKKLGKVPKLVKKSNYNVLEIGISVEKETLKKKIQDRLLARVKKGLVAEVKRLHEKGLTWKRMEELGLEYRYVSRYVRGRLSRDEMLRELEKEIYQYAKRQMTWFRKNKNILWVKPKDVKRVDRVVKTFLSQ